MAASTVMEYFEDIARELTRRSQAIRAWFATHHPSGGNNREALVTNLLSDYLPDRFKLSNGLVYSSNGEFSNQADALIIDRSSNTPLFGGAPVPIWLVESVYALFEVKTKLMPEALGDALVIDLTPVLHRSPELAPQRHLRNGK